MGRKADYIKKSLVLISGGDRRIYLGGSLLFRNIGIALRSRTRENVGTYMFFN